MHTSANFGMYDSMKVGGIGIFISEITVAFEEIL